MVINYKYGLSHTLQNTFPMVWLKFGLGATINFAENTAKKISIKEKKYIVILLLHLIVPYLNSLSTYIEHTNRQTLTIIITVVLRNLHNLKRRWT